VRREVQRHGWNAPCLVRLDDRRWRWAVAAYVIALSALAGCAIASYLGIRRADRRKDRFSVDDKSAVGARRIASR
jgi:hypothetical protein